MRCTPSSLLSLAAASLLTLGLSACGGGGGGARAPTQPVGPQPQTPAGPGLAYLEMISDLIEFSAGIVDPNDPDTITLMHAASHAYEWSADLYIVNLVNPRVAQRANRPLESGTIREVGRKADLVFVWKEREFDDRRCT